MMFIDLKKASISENSKLVEFDLCLKAGHCIEIFLVSNFDTPSKCCKKTEHSWSLAIDFIDRGTRHIIQYCLWENIICTFK